MLRIYNKCDSYIQNLKLFWSFDGISLIITALLWKVKIEQQINENSYRLNDLNFKLKCDVQITCVFSFS